MTNAKATKTRRQLAEAQAARRFDPDDVEPIVIKRTATPVEQVHLFSIVDDDDNEEKFFIPKRVKFNVTIKATETFAAEGEVAATAYMLRALLGDDGYEALINYDDLEQDDFERICEVASNIVLGPRESGKGQLAQRFDEIGWVADLVDDVWADCLHYYGRDIWEMEGAAAMRLAYRLSDVIAADTSTDPPQFRSSLYRAVRDLATEADEATVADLDELAAFDTYGVEGSAVEVVEVGE